MTQRTRTKGSIVNNYTSYTTTTFSGSVVEDPYVNVGSILGVGEFQTTTDVVTPKFKSLISRGKIVNNPFKTVIEQQSYSWSGHVIKTNSGSGSTIKSREYGHFYHDLQGFPGSQWGHLDSLDGALRAACTEAAAGVDSTSVDGATEAAEGRQTMQMFNLHNLNLRRQIQKEIRYAERRGYRFPVSVPTSVMANNWLFYRYGLSPFFSLLNDTMVVGSAIRTRRRTSRGSDSTSHNWEEVTPGGGYYHPSSEWVVTGSAYASTRAGILYEYVNFTNKYGFTLAGMTQAAWNVVPYSFVADWITNAGDWIGAVTPRIGIKRLATWHGYEAHIIRTLTCRLGPVRSGFSVTKDCSGGQSTHTTIVRSRTPGLLAPVLRVRENAFMEVATSVRMYDALALTAQQFLKLMRRTR